MIMKKFSILVSSWMFIASVLLSSGFAEETPIPVAAQKTLKKFTSSDGTFSFSYPANWIISTESFGASPGETIAVLKNSDKEACPIEFFNITLMPMAEEMDFEERCMSIRIGINEVWKQAGRTYEWKEYDIVDDKETGRTILQMHCSLSQITANAELFGVIFSDKEDFYLMTGATLGKLSHPESEKAIQWLLDIYHSIQIQEKEENEKTNGDKPIKIPIPPDGKKIFVSPEKNLYFFYPSDYIENEMLTEASKVIGGIVVMEKDDDSQSSLDNFILEKQSGVANIDFDKFLDDNSDVLIAYFKRGIEVMYKNEYPLASMNWIESRVINDKPTGRNILQLHLQIIMADSKIDYVFLIFFSNANRYTLTGIVNPESGIQRVAKAQEELLEIYRSIKLAQSSGKSNTEPAKEQELKQFTSPDGTFSFSYPSEWHDSNVEKQGGLIAVLENKNRVAGTFDSFRVGQITRSSKLVDLKKISEEFKETRYAELQQEGLSLEWKKFDMVDDANGQNLLQFQYIVRDLSVSSEIWGVIIPNRKNAYILQGIRRFSQGLSEPTNERAWQQLLDIYRSVQISESEEDEIESPTFNGIPKSVPKGKKIFMSPDKTLYFFYPSNWHEDVEMTKLAREQDGLVILTKDDGSQSSLLLMSLVRMAESKNTDYDALMEKSSEAMMAYFRKGREATFKAEFQPDSVTWKESRIVKDDPSGRKIMKFHAQLDISGTKIDHIFLVFFENAYSYHLICIVDPESEKDGVSNMKEQLLEVYRSIEFAK